jgi:hypothetical protein
LRCMTLGRSACSLTLLVASTRPGKSQKVSTGAAWCDRRAPEAGLASPKIAHRSKPAGVCDRPLDPEPTIVARFRVETNNGCIWVFDRLSGALLRKMGCQRIWRGDIINVSRKKPA